MGRGASDRDKVPFPGMGCLLEDRAAGLAGAGGRLEAGVHCTMPPGTER